MFFYYYVEIIKGSGVYLSQSKKTLEARSKHCDKDEEWKQLVLLVLYEIDGNSLKNYCAAGKQSPKTPINSTILDGLYRKKTIFS